MGPLVCTNNINKEHIKIDLFSKWPTFFWHHFNLSRVLIDPFRFERGFWHFLQTFHGCKISISPNCLVGDEIRWWKSGCGVRKRTVYESVTGPKGAQTFYSIFNKFGTFCQYFFNNFIKKIPWQTDKNEIKSHTRCFGKIFWSESQYLTKTFWANWTKTNRDISFWILFLHNEGEHSRKTNENSRKLKLQRYKKIMCFLTSA